MRNGNEMNYTKEGEKAFFFSETTVKNASSHKNRNLQPNQNHAYELIEAVYAFFCLMLK